MISLALLVMHAGLRSGGFLVGFSILLVSSMVNFSHSTAQLQEPSFSDYENGELGIKMEYPSNWVVEYDPNSVPVLRISETGGIDGGRLQLNIEKVTQYLDEEELVVKNKTASDYAAERFSGTSEQFELFEREIFLVKDGFLYEFSFFSPPLRVPETLPLAQKMLDSFQTIERTPEAVPNEVSNGNQSLNLDPPIESSAEADLSTENGVDQLPEQQNQSNGLEQLGETLEGIFNP